MKAPTGFYKLLLQPRARRGTSEESTSSSSVSNDIVGKTLCAFGDAAVNAGALDDEVVRAGVRDARE